MSNPQVLLQSEEVWEGSWLRCGLVLSGVPSNQMAREQGQAWMLDWGRWARGGGPAGTPGLIASKCGVCYPEAGRMEPDVN